MQVEWIAVKDALPETETEVLVLKTDGDMTVRYYVADDGVHPYGWYPGGLGVAWTSHWMRLPDKPKE